MAKGYGSELFEFNLLPKQTKEELMRLQDRDDSTIYGLILVFSSVLIYFILTLIKFLAVDSVLVSVEAEITKTENDIASFNDVRALHGEIYQKATLLYEPFKNDIRLSRLLEIASIITQEKGNVVAYGKVPRGGYSIVVETDNVEDALEIFSKSKEVPEVENPYILFLADDYRTDSVGVTINFNIIELKDE